MTSDRYDGSAIKAAQERCAKRGDYETVALLTMLGTPTRDGAEGAGDILAGLDERLDRLLLTADGASQFILSTDSAKNIVAIVREWIRVKSAPPKPAPPANAVPADALHALELACILLPKGRDWDKIWRASISLKAALSADGAGETIPDGFCSPGGTVSCLHLQPRERCNNCPAVNDDDDRPATCNHWPGQKRCGVCGMGARAAEPDALGYATRLLITFVAEHFPSNPDWKPLPDLIGVLTQIDNAITIARDYKARLASHPVRGDREAIARDLRNYANWTVLTDETHELIEKAARALSLPVQLGAGERDQELNLLRSQLANCHKEIFSLREALLGQAPHSSSEGGR